VLGHPIIIRNAALLLRGQVIDSTGDEFFMPDDDWLWWGQLEGETYRLMIQNAEHSMATGVIELLKGAQAFYDSLILQTQRPKFDWTMDYNGGVITVTTQVGLSLAFAGALIVRWS